MKNSSGLWFCLKKPLLLLAYVSCLVTNGQLKQVGQDSTSFIDIYDGRGKPYEEGILYVSDGPQNTSDHQFLLSLGWFKGALSFEGRMFEDVDLNYNTYEDILLVLSLQLNVSNVKALIIDQSKVEKFVLEGREFINYSKLEKAPEQSGFYENYFGGNNLHCFIKYGKTKSVREDGVGYEEQEKIYLLYRETYYEFKSKRSLYDLFPQYKKELKLYIKKQAPSLKKRNLKNLPLVLDYCDELISDET